MFKKSHSWISFRQVCNTNIPIWNHFACLLISFERIILIRICIFSAEERYHWFWVWSTIIFKNAGECISYSMESSNRSFDNCTFAFNRRWIKLQIISIPLKLLSESRFQALLGKWLHRNAKISKGHQVWTPQSPFPSPGSTCTTFEGIQFTLHNLQQLKYCYIIFILIDVYR